MNSCELDVVVVMLAISISQALIRLLAIIVIITASVNIAFIIRNTPAIIVKPIKLMECYFANIALTSLAIASIIADLWSAFAIHYAKLSPSLIRQLDWVSAGEPRSIGSFLQVYFTLLLRSFQLISAIHFVGLQSSHSLWLSSFLLWVYYSLLLILHVLLHIHFADSQFPYFIAVIQCFSLLAVSSKTIHAWLTLSLAALLFSFQTNNKTPSILKHISSFWQ